MRKYSLPLRAAALFCALCLLLTGCGQVASPDDSGAPVPTAEPAVEETKSALEELGLTDVEIKAAQLAAKHLGQDAVLTDVVEFSSDALVPATYHVLLMKDTKGNYLAYRYGTGSVYCRSEEELQSYDNNVLDSEEAICTYLLLSLSRHTSDLYISGQETVTKLAQSEVEEVNLALSRGEIPADVAEEARAAQDELEASQHAATGMQAAQLAAQLAAEHLGKDTMLTNVVEFSLDDLGGVPCHVLLLRNANDRYLAYSYDTETVYCPPSYDVGSDIEDWSTEENRCLYLLWIFADHVNGWYDNYVNSSETRIELPASEVQQANLALSLGEIPTDTAAKWKAVQETEKAAQEKEKAARLAAIEAQAASLTDVEMQAARLTAEYLPWDAVLTDAVEYSLDDFEGSPCHVLLLKSANNEFLAYSYNTETVYCPSSNDVWDNNSGDLSTEEDRCLYLLWELANRSRVHVGDQETLTRLGVGQVNLLLHQGDITEEGQTAQQAEVSALAVQLAAEYLGKDSELINVMDYSVVDGTPCHVLLLLAANDRFLAYDYDSEAVYCPSSNDVWDNNSGDLSTEKDRCTYLLWIFANTAWDYVSDQETRTSLSARQINLALSQGDVPEEVNAAQYAAVGAQAVQLAAEHLGENSVLTNVVDISADDFGGASCHVLLLKDADDRFLAYSYDSGAVYCPSSSEVRYGFHNDFSTEKNRCTYLLCVLADCADGTHGSYVNSGETRTELTAKEIEQANRALAGEDVQSAADAAALTDLQIKAAELTAAAIKAQAVRVASEHWGQDAVLTDAAEYSVDNFMGNAYHFLLLRAADDRLLAYSYDTGEAYGTSVDELYENVDSSKRTTAESLREALKTEEGRGLYILRPFDNHTGVYWDDEETRTELTAAEIAKVNGALALGIVPAAAEEIETLPADAALPEGSGAYRVLDECPEEFARRELSDEELLSLAQEGDLEAARGRISTGGDFAAWLVAMGGRLSSNVSSNDEGQKTIGAIAAFDWMRQMVDSAMAAALAVRVLGDYLPGIGIVAARVAENGGTLLCGNLIPAEDGYYLISFDALTDEWKDAVEAEQLDPEAFPPVWVDGTAGITAWCQSADNPRGSTLLQAFCIPGDQQVVLDYKDELYTPQNPLSVQEFFRDEALAAEVAEQRIAYIRPENIGNYELSTKLGGTTLTPEEAYALLDMEPEQVKERVKTAADVLMLMLAGQYSDCHGDRTKMINGQEWHYNLNAFQVMQTRTTNCGSAANLANYLLEGDYEEIGFILHAYYIENNGGHVYNYFKYQGKYYIVDFSWYMFANYQPKNDFPVMELDRLEDYGSRIPELYGGVCMAFAHTSPGQHYPNVFDAQNGIYAIPEGVEYKLLYQETGSNCYILTEYPLDKSQLDWTTFGEP